MQNKFDIDNHPTEMPAELTAGADWYWRLSDITAAYPTATYSVEVEFTRQDDHAISFSLNAAKVDAEHRIQSADTDGRAAGFYRWQAWVIRDSDSARVVADQGFVTIHPNTGAGPSYTYRVLTAIQATIEGTASSDQSRIEIGGRTIESRSIEDLLRLEREFTRRWADEKAATERKAGRTGKKRVLAKLRA